MCLNSADSDTRNWKKKNANKQEEATHFVLMECPYIHVVLSTTEYYLACLEQKNKISRNVKPRRGGDRFVWFVDVYGKYSVALVSFLIFCLKCLNGVLPMAVQTFHTWKSKSPGIAYHWRTKNCFPNGSQKFGESTGQLMSTVLKAAATTIKLIALKRCRVPCVST